MRDRILEAALATLRAGGSGGFTQVAVARRAGVRQSHLTYYFPTRHDLLEATVSRFVETIEAGFADRPDAALGRFAEAVTDLGHMRMFLGLVVEAADDPSLRAIIARGTERVEGTLAAALGGSDAPERARVALATIWGLGLYGFALRPDPERNPTAAGLANLERGPERRPARAEPRGGSS